MAPMKNTLYVIDGPTASGKTNLAYNLALKWNCPVISADSRQIFKGVNIGTAKPPKNYLKTVKHYFIDQLDIDASYNVGLYEKQANQLIDELFKSHERLILCGGSGLYIKSVLQGLNDLPASTKEIRSIVHDLFEKNGIEALQKFVRVTDPDYYNKVDLNNARRLSRAVEVFLMSGRPFSSFDADNHREKNYSFIELTLIPERNELYDAIDKRVDEMIANGLIDETNALLDFKSTQAMDTVGYKEIIAYLEKQINLQDAISLIKQRTRNYAKRQITWFHKESKGTFINSYDEKALAEAVVKL
jgi:tRNA dimethylallyltransferase